MTLKANPGMTIVDTIPAYNEALLSAIFQKKVITIDYTSYELKVLKNTLFGRQTATPGKYGPFHVESKITSTVNSGNAVMTMTTASETARFKVGDSVTFFDVSAVALSAERKTISAISLAAGTITITGTWSAPPAANDYLVLADGTELSADVVMVDQEVDFPNMTVDVCLSAVYAARLDENQVKRVTLDSTASLTKSEVQRLIFDKPQR